MKKLLRAFEIVERANFLPQTVVENAHYDSPLPIGYNQTNSQPTTVKMMLEWLGVREGDKVLDVGSGSGWTTALLSYLVGPKGEVFAVEKIPQLVEFGRQNCERIGVSNAKFFKAGEEFGLSSHAPYDRILVSASAAYLPPKLIDQLKPGGKMIIPVQNDILEITKTKNNSLTTITHPGFVFVPLV